MEGPIRVAHVIGMACNGGVETVMMNYYRHIDKTKVQFDFLVESESKIINKEEIESMGGRVIIIPSYKKLKQYNKALTKIFKENKYDIVHSNMNTLSVFPLRIAKKCGVKVRIAHSHSTSNKKEWKRNILKNILRPFSKVFATDYFACSELAGRYLFGKKAVKQGKVKIIINGIEVDKFKFNEKVRNEVRKKLKIEDKFVIGHVGRFMTQKNHDFLIDAFNSFSKVRDDAVLLLVGDGPLMDKIKFKVQSYGITEKVIFVGTTNSPAEYYNAMDLFAFPSLYEGLGMVAVEAQINGLPCIASNYVPKEIKISEYCTHCNLDVEKWVSEMNQGRFQAETEYQIYDIKEASKHLQKIYDDFGRKTK